MIFQFKPLILVGSVSAIAGMAITTALTSPQSKAIDYSNSVLSLERLSTINFFKVSQERLPEGLLVRLAPQSTEAIRSQFGSPVSVTEYRDTYLVLGKYDGSIPSQKVVFNYETNLATGGIPKATTVLIPSDLVQSGQ